MFAETTYVELFASSAKQYPVEIKLVVEAYAVITGKRISRKVHDRTLGANRATELVNLVLPPEYNVVKNATVIGARLIDSGSQETLARVSLWPEP